MLCNFGWSTNDTEWRRDGEKYTHDGGTSFVVVVLAHLQRQQCGWWWWWWVFGWLDRIHYAIRQQHNTYRERETMSENVYSATCRALVDGRHIWWMILHWIARTGYLSLYRMRAKQQINECENLRLGSAKNVRKCLLWNLIEIVLTIFNKGVYLIQC